MSEYLELDHRRVLVTGGTKGIGEAVVARLREAGGLCRRCDTKRSLTSPVSLPGHVLAKELSHQLRDGIAVRFQGEMACVN